MQIQFCGASRFVTGSAHLITLEDGFKILLDCGLYQGNDSKMKGFNESFLFKPSEIDCVILSHGHIDHSGRIPKLVKDGFQGNIYTTHATRSLCSVMLMDSARIQMRDADYDNKKLKKRLSKEGIKEVPKEQLKKPLYDTKDVKKTMDLFAGLAYNKSYRIHKGIVIHFRDAGHILGSASVTLKITENGKTTKIGFTGDIGRPNRPILRDPLPMPKVDILICESTYGDKLHDEAPREVGRFLDILKHTCLEKKGKLIIPAFSVGRTQEIVYMLDQLETDGMLPHIPVYVDSPLSVNATSVFSAHPECYDSDLQEYLIIDANPFGFNALTYIHDVAASKALNKSNEPCIIISSSGMANAGRVKHHIFNNIEKPETTILIVGYCAPHTPGGALRRGKKELKLFGEWLQVKADVEVMDSFSAHGDQQEMIDFIANQKDTVKKLFLVHGEFDTQRTFKTKLEQIGYENVTIPELGQIFDVS